VHKTQCPFHFQYDNVRDLPKRCETSRESARNRSYREIDSPRERQQSFSSSEKDKNVCVCARGIIVRGLTNETITYMSMDNVTETEMRTGKADVESPKK